MQAWKRGPRALLAAALLVLGIGCDDLLDDTQPLPEFARYELTGTSPVNLEVITSTLFQVITDFELQQTYVQFTLSDTVLTVPPLADDLDIRPTGRFLIRVTNYSDSVADVRLQVSFDGVVEYDQAAFMSAGASLEFSQVFSGT